MEEVVVSSEEMELRAESETEMEMEMEMEEEKYETESETAENKKMRKKTKKLRKRKGGNSSGVVRWENFLRRMRLRVLLIEADDSTRQIIGALLRKCSYRVTAVPDGLKAWEILKGRPHNIDLILTEVDLPAISGFALLTLIAEHEICKNIPVIMMSAQDSVSTVYKCMLRGAADYLVKPIRRNELRNLWQHVWRKQSSNLGINDPQDESVAQQQLEATSENNAAASKRSNGRMACIQRNTEQIEKGSDEQSSCTKPELEAESVRVENMQEFSQPKWGKSFPSDIISQNKEEYLNFGQKFLMHGSEAEGSEVDTCKDDNTTPPGKDIRLESHNRDTIITNEDFDNNYVLVNSSRKAIDLIGSFHNHPNCGSEGINKFDHLPQLDLSLRRSHFSGLCNSYTEERRTLGTSNASAFTRYTNRALKPPQTKITNACNQQKEYGTNSEQMLSNTFTSCSSDNPGITQRSIISLAAGHSKESDVATSCSQQRVFPVPIPVKGIRVNNLYTGFGSALPPMFCTQSGSLPTPSPNSVPQQEPSFQMNVLYQSSLENNNFEQQYDPQDQNTNDAANQDVYKQEHKLDPLEDRGHVSSATDQSASSSICNGGVSHHNSIGYGSGCGSNSNVDHVAFVGSAPESKNEDGLYPQNGSAHRSIQREAALAKFRLKRKERCYEKKVRYESRKKLAEQRPRVKGQFVRQVHIDPSPSEIDGNSYDG